jgi:rhodanese-related sulfurtransferase
MPCISHVQAGRSAPPSWPYRDKPVILVCNMGQQAGCASKQLKAAGFSKVYKMAGGMMEWSNLQLPTVSK